MEYNLYQIHLIATPILKRATAHVFGGLLWKNPLFEGFLLGWWWWRYYQKFDGPSLHPIKLQNVMAIKAFCEKLMAITDGPSLMDHHRHVWLLLYINIKNILGHYNNFGIYFILRFLRHTWAKKDQNQSYRASRGSAFVKQKVYNLEMHMHSMMQCWWVITFRRLWTKSFLAWSRSSYGKIKVLRNAS